MSRGIIDVTTTPRIIHLVLHELELAESHEHYPSRGELDTAYRRWQTIRELAAGVAGVCGIVGPDWLEQLRELELELHPPEPAGAGSAIPAITDHAFARPFAPSGPVALDPCRTCGQPRQEHYGAVSMVRP